jgi:hypothetical protein
MATEVGTLVIDLKAQVARLETDMKRAANGVGRASRQIDAAAGFAKRAILGLAGAVGVQSFASMIKSQIDLADELGKTSQKLGISVEGLSAYQYAAKLSGVANDQLKTGLTQLAKQMEDAGIHKTAATAQAFKALGIEVTDSNGRLRDTGAVFNDLSKRFAEAPDGPNKTAAAMRLLGQSGADLIPMMNNVSELTAEAERMGAVVSTKFAKQAEHFNDSSARMETAIGNFARRIAMSVLPELASMTEHLNVLIGAQDRVSVGSLETDLERLRSRHEELTRQRERAIIIGDISKTQLGRETVAVVSQIRELEKLIALEKERLAAKKLSVPTPGGGRDLPTLMNESGAGPNAGLAAAGLEKYAQDLQTRAAALDESLKSELDREREHFTQRFELLERAEEMFGEQGGRWNTAREALVVQHQERLHEIEKQALDARQAVWMAAYKGNLQGLSGVMGEMSELMQSSSKKQFEIGKRAAQAKILVDAASMIQSAYATQPFFPLGLLMGASAIALAAKNWQRINSIQFNGGGSPGGATPTFSANPNTGLPADSLGGGFNPAPRQSDQSRGDHHTTIIINGTVIGNAREWLENEAIPIIRDAVQSRDLTLIPAGSRNAADIARAES